MITKRTLCIVTTVFCFSMNIGAVFAYTEYFSSQKDGKTIKGFNARYTQGGGEKFLTPASEFFFTPEKALKEAKKIEIEFQQRAEELKKKKAEEEKLKAMQKEAKAEKEAQTKKIILTVIISLIAATGIVAIYLFRKKIAKSFLLFFILALYSMLFSNEVAFAVTTQKFSDIPPSNKYYPAIQFIDGKVLDLQWRSNGIFHPDEPVTRAMACVYFLQSAGITIPQSMEKNDFHDVEQGSWYHPCVQTAKDWRFISGYPDRTFHPMENITNAAALAFFFNAHAVEPVLYLNNVSGHWYEKYTLHAREKNIINSDFDPNAEITKGQLIDMIYRFLKQGPLAKVPNSFLKVTNGCSITDNLKKELQEEIKKMPKPEQISLAEGVQGLLCKWIGHRHGIMG